MVKIEEDSTQWKIYHSLWIIWSLVMFLNGIGFFVIGFKAKERNWFIEGAIYEFFFIVALIVEMVNPSAAETFAGIYVITWLISIIRSIWLNGAYHRKIKELSGQVNPNYQQNYNQNYNHNMNQNYNHNMNQNYNHNMNQNYNQDMNQNYNQGYNQNNNSNYNQSYNQNYTPDYNQNNSQNNDIQFDNSNQSNFNEADNKITFNNPSPTENNNQNTIDFNDVNDNAVDFNNIADTNVNVPNIGIIDINTATAGEISQLPGINMIQAKKIIQLRNSGVYINSLEDFATQLGLNNHQIDQIKNNVKFSNIDLFSGNRRIDL